ncbi:MAG TPA: hypothetical protein ENJ82_13265 [Bacteroidetes bacterium]|nr:hypothetical protein [Bacteroidota bacterium]
MQYVKLLNGFRQIRKQYTVFNSSVQEAVQQPYLGNASQMHQAGMVIQLATLGWFPSLFLLLFYAYHGTLVGMFLFAGPMLALPIWYFLLRARWPGVQLISHLFVLATVISFHEAIYFSNGLQSPFFTWQILSPLSAIFLVNWRGLIFWGSVSFLLLCGWYFIDIPTQNDLLIGSESNIRTVSYLILYLTHLISLWLLLNNRRRIFAIQFHLESEMKKGQMAIAGIVEGQLKERGKIYRELSGDLGPMLYGIRAQQQSLIQKGLIPKSEVKGLEAALATIEVELERISRNLQSSELAENGLSAAILNLCSHLENTTSVQVKVNLPVGVTIVMDARSMHIYRIIQEAFRNISQHAQARNVYLGLRLEADQIVAMHIEDDGMGMPRSASHKGPQPQRIGQGLQNIADRVALLNGHLSIDTAASGGTRIRISLPDPIHQRLRLPFK